MADVMGEFVFEDGDIGKGLLIARMQEDGYPKPIFKPKKARKIKGGVIERECVASSGR